MPPSARIVATGHYLPSRRVTNDDLRARAEAAQTIDRFEATTGIRQRWHAEADQATSDLALAAAQQALERAGLAPSALDLIVVGTDTPDYITPATSTVLQAKLGAHRAGTFDIGCACASFPSALATAHGLMGANAGVRHALVTGAYLMSRHAAEDDLMSFFYGDGAGAAVVTAGDQPGVLGAAFAADGRYAGYWGIDAGGTVEPVTEQALAAGRHRVRVKERYPPEINEQGWPALVRTLAERCGFNISAIDHAVFTQVNRSTIDHTCAELGLPRERAITVMEQWGYTGSACVPMALDQLVTSGHAHSGELVVMVGSGVGYNMAAVAVRLGDDLVSG